MAYKVYRRDKGSESVELVNDKIYETREEAEAAMHKAENEYKETIPLPTEIFGPRQTTLPADELTKGENPEEENQVEFFIREA